MLLRTSKGLTVDLETFYSVILAGMEKGRIEKVQITDEEHREIFTLTFDQIKNLNDLCLYPREVFYGEKY